MTADIPWKQLSKAAGFPNLREGESAVGKQVPAPGSLSNFMFNLIKCELCPEESEGEHHYVEFRGRRQGQDGDTLLL